MGHYLVRRQALQLNRFEKLAVLQAYRSWVQKQAVIHYLIVQRAIAYELGEPHPVAVLVRYTNM